ncbi:MAG TPA: hypothetical protein VN445_08730, partial [Rectinemataceae bacterium]|nr:hypothetical protein [Rectinemataceae bacterium]
LFTVVDPSAIRLKPLCGLRFSPSALSVGLGFPWPSLERSMKVANFATFCQERFFFFRSFANFAVL